VASLVRGLFAPLVAPLVPLATRPRWVAAEVFRLLGQLRVAYRDSPLSVHHGRRCCVRAGDRLPNATITTAGVSTSLHQLTSRPGVHVLLRHDAPALSHPDDAHIHIHRVEWSGPAMTVVRPDGYVGLCTDTADAAELTGWLSLIGVPGPSRSRTA
jgi:hypothetical protein